MQLLLKVYQNKITWTSTWLLKLRVAIQMFGLLQPSDGSRTLKSLSFLFLNSGNKPVVIHYDAEWVLILFQSQSQHDMILSCGQRCMRFTALGQKWTLGHFTTPICIRRCKATSEIWLWRWLSLFHKISSKIQYEHHNKSTHKKNKK
jgi:hypothetical protein